MKKLLLSIVFVVVTVAMLVAQTPQMTYQAVIRDFNGQLLTNRSVQATVKIKVGESELFNQTYTESTNVHGLLTVTFGNADFATIDWANASISCEVRNGSDVYIAENFQPVTAVPLAIKAISESDPQFNVSVASDITTGDTLYWNHKLDAEVDGSVTNELQALSISHDTVYLSSNGGFVKLPEVNVTTSLDDAYHNGSFITADNGPVTINGTDGLLATGTLNSGTIPASGAGARMMWYPRKAAFRAGYVFGNQWNDTIVGNISIALGINTTASGSYSTSMGNNTIASGDVSTAMGISTKAIGDFSTSMGVFTTASGNNSTAMGSSTTASGYNSTAMGVNTEASGDVSTAMGIATAASGLSSTAIGNNTTASGESSTAMGNNSTASEESSTAMGVNTIASGSYSTAMGVYTTSSGLSSTAMGNNTIASGAGSTAMGISTKAIGDLSTAMGVFTTASGNNSTAMGVATTASGYNSTAMGVNSTASGDISTSMGVATTASGKFATTMGESTKAQSYASVVLGKYNLIAGDSLNWVETDPLFVIGNGTSSTYRSNALTVYKNGNMDVNGNMNVNGILTATGGNSTNWNTAYGWGNHASAGYLTAEVDGSVSNELQALSISHDTIYLSNGGFVKLPTTDGSETKVTAGIGVSISGSGTTDSPYVVAAGEHYLGEEYLDGIIFYLYIGSDGQQHGLVVSKAENTAQWQGTPSTTDATRSWDGIYNMGLMTNSPAKDWITGAFTTDWYLPSIDELSILWHNRFHVNKALNNGGFTTLSNAPYWSSTEENDSYAFSFYFDYGYTMGNNKPGTFRVRAVRSF